MTSPESNYPPYTPAPVGSRPPRKRSKWLIALAVVAVVVFAVCAFGIVRLYLGLKNVSDIDENVERATAAFIDDTRDGLSPAGFEGLCAEAKEEFAQPDLAKPPAAGKAVTGYRIASSTVDYDRRQATVRVELQRADGTTSQETYILQEEADRWKMCAFPL